MGFFQETATAVTASNYAIGGWGRSVFANNFAEGGLASYMFPMKDYQVKRGFLGMKAAPGSKAYNQNLQALIDRGSKAEAEAAKKLMAKYAGKSSLGWRMSRGLKGGAIGAALIVGFALMAEGGAGEKVKAGMGGVGAAAGWAVGAKAGAAIGAAIGSYIPVVGTAVGALAGAVVGAFAGSALGQTIGEATWGFLDSIAERGKKVRRTSNWIGDLGTFRTQKAATMRQASLMMMNNGMMTARSALGSEGIMFHQ